MPSYQQLLISIRRLFEFNYVQPLRWSGGGGGGGRGGLESCGLGRTRRLYNLDTYQIVLLASFRAEAQDHVLCSEHVQTRVGSSRYICQIHFMCSVDKFVRRNLLLMIYTSSSCWYNGLLRFLLDRATHTNFFCELFLKNYCDRILGPAVKPQNEPHRN